jgi:hypothetical protein
MLSPDYPRNRYPVPGLLEQERRAGSIVIEIHYDSEGAPKKAWVQARAEIDLKDGQ